MGSQASGETGLNTWITGFTASYRYRFSPTTMPRGIATSEARTKPENTVPRLVRI